jgi:Protein of unknown function (DUF2934)
MNQNQWDEYGRIVTEEMREHTRPFVASIFLSLSSDEGRLLASGTYLELLDKPYLLTNWHVAKALETRSLGHQLADDEYSVRFTNPFQTYPYPLDLALSRVDLQLWNSETNQKRALPVDRFAQRHDAVTGELFFLMGFSGERSYFSPSLKYIFPTGTPYTTQECPVPPESYLPDFHLTLHYSPDRALSLDRSSRGLPVARGLSGSIVWNTRAVQCLMAGRKWTPAEAEVTGIVWGCDSKTACLVATRIEHVRTFLLQALRQEAAYFLWLNRGQPVGDDLADWYSVSREIPELG